MIGEKFKNKIKVLLVDDSILALTILQRVLAGSDEITVIGTARNGKEAVEKIATNRPDVVCADFHMPIMNGYELTREIMSINPIPILIISNSVQILGDEHNIFNLLEAGAVDVFPKPLLGTELNYKEIREELIQKIKIVSNVKPFRRQRRRSITQEFSESLQSNATQSDLYKIVVIGSSTGGPLVLAEMFSQIPANFPLPILCVQHISTGFLEGLVQWLGSCSSLKLTIANDGDDLLPGTVYFPKENNHLIVDTEGKLMSSNALAVGGHRPSINVTFSSAAGFFKKKTIGILLTGMGKDGALGLSAIRNQGGYTIVQNEESCVVFGMPKAAIELHAAVEVLPPKLILEKLLKITQKM